MKRIYLLLTILVLFYGIGCSTKIVKPKALDTSFLESNYKLNKLLKKAEDEQSIVNPDILWMDGIDSRTDLTFAALRQEAGKKIFCLVLDCSPDKDSLILLPLESDETPISVLADNRKLRDLRQIAELYNPEKTLHDEIIRVSIKEAIHKKLLGSPLPEPKHIYAVAANFPSHLNYDLAIDDIESKKKILNKALARVFLKYPAVNPPPMQIFDENSLSGLLGPFDEITYPEMILIPKTLNGTLHLRTSTKLDYEVEIGVVFQRRLTWEMIKTADDDEIRSAIAGFVLINDTKVRNPQVMLKVLCDECISQPDDPYRIDDKTLDMTLGIWDQYTCHWWSYAASCGRFTSIGPFFVVAPDSRSFPSRAIMCARSYGSQEQRKYPKPENCTEDVLYLRQFSKVTEQDSYPDSMIWNIPKIVRSILSPESVLSFTGTEPTIEAGDIICMGTPGGTVLTSMPFFIFDISEDILFWKEPLFWHDIFFKRKSKFFLHNGDKLFLWGQGLGFQYLTVRQDYNK